MSAGYVVREGEREVAAYGRFAVIEQTLTDGSCVYGVRFFADDDPSIRIDIDCETQAHADELAQSLEENVLSLMVDVPELEEVRL